MPRSLLVLIMMVMVKGAARLMGMTHRRCCVRLLGMRRLRRSSRSGRACLLHAVRTSSTATRPAQLQTTLCRHSNNHLIPSPLVCTVLASEGQKLMALPTTLSDKVAGQETATETVADAIFFAGLATSRNRVVQFLGPTGVGKTGWRRRWRIRFSTRRKRWCATTHSASRAPPSPCVFSTAMPLSETAALHFVCRSASTCPST